MSYGIVYLRRGDMMLRRLNAQFNYGNEVVVKDALPEAKRELVTPRTVGMVWIKEPGELFMLGTVEMEPGEGAPQSMAEILYAAEADQMLRSHLVSFFGGWHEALMPSVPGPIWDS